MYEKILQRLERACNKNNELWKIEIVPLTDEENKYYEKQTPKEIPIVFHNGSTHDYHFIINKVAKEFDGQLECLGENTEK